MSGAMVRAYDELMEATALHAAASDEVAEARLELEAWESQALYLQWVDGANQQERNAALRMVLDPYYERLNAAEREQRRRRLDLDLARLLVDAERTRLRWAELEVEAMSLATRLTEVIR